MTDSGKILYKDECYAIQGAIFEVYREMGCGFVEPVYQECMKKELNRKGVPALSQPSLEILYKGEPIDQTYKPDFICFNKIIVELKAVKELCDRHRAQTFNYLRATSMRLGLLVNFGSHPQVTIERMIV